MKTFELKEVTVLVEIDDAANEEKILVSGDEGNEYEKFYEIINDDVSTLCVPQANGNVFFIHNVVARYIDENNDYLRYGKLINEEEISYIFFFEGAKEIQLGTKENGEFYFCEEQGKKFAACFNDNELTRFEYLRYLENDDHEVIVFEVAPERFRIFSNDGYCEPKEKETEFVSICSENDDTVIFYWHNGKNYQEVARTETLCSYDNAFLIQNDKNGLYELYGFEDGKQILLYSGKDYEVDYSQIIIDNLMWEDADDDGRLLNYTPETYVPETE